MSAVDSTAIENVLTFEALHLALTRCMAAHPPCGLDFQMHPDVNVIAGLWGLMNYVRAQSVPVDHVKPEVMAAYHRWAPRRAARTTAMIDAPTLGYGLATGVHALVIQHLVFTAISGFGVWRWLVVPRSKDAPLGFARGLSPRVAVSRKRPTF